MQKRNILTLLFCTESFSSGGDPKRRDNHTCYELGRCVRLQVPQFGFRFSVRLTSRTGSFLFCETCRAFARLG
jgi:hypothetical protein